jgi:hypothetical protein
MKRYTPSKPSRLPKHLRQADPSRGLTWYFTVGSPLSHFLGLGSSLIRRRQLGWKAPRQGPCHPSDQSAKVVFLRQPDDLTRSPPRFGNRRNFILAPHLQEDKVKRERLDRPQVLASQFEREISPKLCHLLQVIRRRTVYSAR